MANKIQLRRDTAANWTSVNPVLSQGEPGLETDTNKVKYGDGTTAWTGLTYASTGGGGSSTPTRQTVSVTTTALPSNQAINETVVGAKGYALYSIQVSSGAWVTVYSSVAARTADANRALSTDPASGAGILAEIISTGATTQYFTPAVIGYSAEVPPNTNIPLKILNNTGSTTPITVTLTFLPLES